VNFKDAVKSPSKVITIRYRDRYVDLVSDSEYYGMMTQSADGERIEFDFSQCRVVGTRSIPTTGTEVVVSNGGRVE
jgi:hypothetical protein